MTTITALGDYTIIEQIGQGALGALYLAEHRYMKKNFAIKVLPEEITKDRGFIQRFEEEIGLLSTLDHPNIVKLHNISYDNGRYFLVSDCVVDEIGENTNLSQYVQAKGGHLSENEVYRLLEQIADALEYAHNLKGKGSGIVHRGIKLNNILIGKGVNGPHLYLSDYGLSRIIGTGTFLTRTFKMVAESLGVSAAVEQGIVDGQKVTPLHSTFIQSFQFLAPEQRHPELKIPLTGKVDIYAVGVLAYYLLTGSFPEGYFDLPSKRKGNLKGYWDEFIMACLRPNPENRASSLIGVLKKVKEHGPSHGSQSVQHQVNNNQVFAQNNQNQTRLQSQQQTQQQTQQHAQQHMQQQTQQQANQQTQQHAQQHSHQQSHQQTQAHGHHSTESDLRPVIQSQKLERPVHDPDPARVFQIETSVRQFTPENKTNDDIQPILTDMVVVEGGAFYRGSTDGNRDEMPRHEITLDSFAIDIHPVTNDQFVRFLEAMGGVKDTNHNDIIRLKDSRINNSKGRFSIESGYVKHPVVGVTWYGAVAYAKWVGKRLPTEAEWEIAACGGDDNNLYPTGDDIEKTEANFFSSDTTVVMSYPPNKMGIYDLAGNVYEWCQDWYGYNYYEVAVQEPINPNGPLQGVYRVLRGGCWKSLKEDLRCSRRHRNNPGTVNGTYGFRCAADVRCASQDVYGVNSDETSGLNTIGE